MKIRDQRQIEFANQWLQRGEWGILHLCPRFGKIRTSIYALNKLGDQVNVLIAYPDVNIKKSWMSDFEELGYDNPNVVYTTHMSLKNHTMLSYDVVIIDEIHLLSEAQIIVCQSLFENTSRVIGLSGTLSKDTAKRLHQALNLKVVAEYPLETAIKEGVIVDYEITVVTIPLNDRVKIKYKKTTCTEKVRFKALSYVIEKLEEEKKDTFFMRLQRMRLIQNSVAKKFLTQKLIAKHDDERILVFCGTIETSESLGIPFHHSKSKNKEEFDQFVKGEGNHMAVIKIGNTGVTYKPLNRIVISYFDSNAENLAQKIQRCTAMEYDNPDKKAHIYITSSDEDVELNWLKRALQFFSKEKIKYITSSEL